jgi:hypothetical protein
MLDDALAWIPTGPVQINKKPGWGQGTLVRFCLDSMRGSSEHKLLVTARKTPRRFL